VIQPSLVFTDNDFMEKYYFIMHIFQAILVL